MRIRPDDFMELKVPCALGNLRSPNRHQHTVFGFRYGQAVSGQLPSVCGCRSPAMKTGMPSPAQTEKCDTNGRKQRNLRSFVMELARIDQRPKLCRLLPVEPGS